MLRTSAVVWSMPPRLMRILPITLVEFLCGKVAKQGVKQLVDVGGGADGGTFGVFLQLAALAELQSCHDGNTFGGAETFEPGEVPYFPFGQPVEVVAAGGEYTLHQCHGCFFRIAGADENGEQLGIAQGFRPFLHHLFPRAILFRPLVDIQFLHS